MGFENLIPYLVKKYILRPALILVLFLLFFEFFWLSYHLIDSNRSIRVRNSLLLITSEYNNINWSPNGVPKSFKQETLKPPSVFKDIVLEVTNSDQSNLEKAISLAQHLRKTPGPETPVKSNSITTYYEIVKNGLGYCADYTQVFVALAHAASIPVREWGFAIDNYNGGHAFVEIWEPKISNWVFIDPSISFIVIDKITRKPLSVYEFNYKLLHEETETISIIPILEGRFGWRDKNGALDFYKRGAKQFFLYWGNNIFTYENNTIIRLAEKLSRSMGQFIGIMIGVNPEIMLLTNDPYNIAIKNIKYLRYTTMIILYTLPILILLAALLGVLILKSYKKSNNALEFDN